VNQTQEAIRLLTAERTAIDAALRALNGGGGAGTGTGTARQPAASLPAGATGTQIAAAGKRKVSATARRHMAEAQKVRWATKNHPLGQPAARPVAAAPVAVAAKPAARKRAVARSYKKKAAVARRKAAPMPVAEKVMTA
jgi:hypothetical protein